MMWLVDVETEEEENQEKYDAKCPPANTNTFFHECVANLLNAQTIILSLNLLLFMHISLFRFFVLYSILFSILYTYYSLSVFVVFF